MTHKTPSTLLLKEKPLKSALRITLIYTLFGIAWIAFSDKILLFLTGDQESFYQISLYKGWFYVLLTSVLLFWLTKQSLSESYGLTIQIVESLKALEKTQATLNEKMNTITQLAYYDDVTTLPNRLHFSNFVANKIESAPDDFALVYIDLDHFKLINDAVGHRIGDELLVVFAKRLKSFSDRAECVARLSGDEFALLVSHLEPNDVFLDKLSEVIRNPLTLHGREFYLTASIGISLYQKDGSDFDTLLRKADTAMYASKERGRDQVVFFQESLEAEVLEYVDLHSKMQVALLGGHFFMHYQPLFDLKTQKLFGAESLIRWQHPEKGFISPVKFISIAEKTGFIKPLGAWIIEAVFGQVAQWQDQLPEAFACSINLSSLQIEEPSFLDLIASLMSTYKIKPNQIVFEITENISIENNPQTLKKLEALRAWGFKIALDDFGTGYSSLSTLSRMPLDYIKLDKSFVFTIETSHKNKAISEAVIMLCQSTGLKVVAEGIETEVQRDILRALNCHLGQGYLYSKPISPQAFSDLYFSQ